eukprot:gnl/MRDRNA2_/MRDRNA2_85835_c0_seq1.p1 gnl/MRDRNA2_/MRDRNA2_85835_c0~~gnl/MRDRNA2_/MRDRNA2_85835_c0_seq1.p1  ORF type:complete len:393 (+),score=66.40 gnl/MRDRNA2_/MRDRNA2_85835_c0_seq1:116-1294(+)
MCSKMLDLQVEKEPTVYDLRANSKSRQAEEVLAAIPEDSDDSSFEHMGMSTTLTPPDSARGRSALDLKHVTTLTPPSSSGGYSVPGPKLGKNALPASLHRQDSSKASQKAAIQRNVASLNVILESQIGKGTFSIVYSATSPKGPVAIKVLTGKSSAVDEAEVAMLRKMDHPNIVKLIDVIQDSTTTCVILELCAGGDLYRLLHVTKLKLGRRQKLFMLQDVAEAIQYLHSQDIIHRDIKSANCLLVKAVEANPDAVLSVKVADFGLSKQMDLVDAAAHMTKGIGSSRWMAPEVYAGNEYSSSVDIYSFGIFMYEVISQELPYGSESTEGKFVLKVCLGLRPDTTRLPTWCTMETCALMTSCWSRDPRERPAIEAVVEGINSALVAKLRRNSA